MNPLAKHPHGLARREFLDSALRAAATAGLLALAAVCAGRRSAADPVPAACAGCTWRPRCDRVGSGDPCAGRGGRP